METGTSTATLVRTAASRPADEIWAHVERDGGVVVEGLLDAGTVDALNRESDEAVAALAPGAKNELFNVFYGANTKRYTDLIRQSPTFRNVVLQDETVLALADKVMTRLSDSYWLQSCQLIEIGPGNPRQMLHRDMANYPVFLPQGPAAPEVTMNFLIALTEFREDNGCTRIIPGSNHWPDFYDIDQEVHQAMTIGAVMKPGDALLISGKVLHGGGANVTTGEYRRALSMAFNPGFLVPEQAFPFEVPIEVVRTLPSKIQQMLGFRSFHNDTNHGGSLWLHNYTEVADFLGLD